MITGGDELARRLAEIGQKTAARIGDQVLPDLGDELLERAREAAPMQTGRLRESGFVERTAEGVDVGFSAPYALSVHERTDVPHPVGGAKFLERPLFETGPELERRIGAALEEEIG